jgi:predicted MFS family arabinose efflux permease
MSWPARCPLWAEADLTFSPRTAITLTFVAFGILVGAQIGAIPVLKAQAGVDAFTFGILAGLCTAANILALALGGYTSRWFDNRSVILFILPIALVALVASLMVHSIWTFGATFIVFNFCLGTLDLFMNAEASFIEHELNKPIFASFHAAVLYAIGAAGLAGGYIAVTYGALWSALLAVPIVALTLWAVNAAIPHRKEDGAKRASAAPLPRKLLALIGIIIGLDVACELACVQWSGQLLAEMQPSLAQYSGLGVAFYGLCNGTVRLVGDRLRARFNDMTLVAISLCIGILGFAVLATGPSFAISVIAFAVAGSGLGLIFPCLFSVAAKLAPNSPAAALGFASGISGPPRILLPMVLGVLAQSYGLSAIYIAAALAALIAVGFTVWAAHEINLAKP